MSPSDRNELRLTGISASPGICIGKAYLVDTEGVDVVKRYHLPPEHLKAELNRFRTAVNRAQDDLNTIIAETPEEFRDHSDIIETHVVLLKDKMLFGKTIETIEREKVNAEWALKKVVSGLRAIFQEMEDTYFRERATDVVQVSDRIMQHLTGVEAVNIGRIDKRVILIARDLSPAQTSQIQLERIKGFATEMGGRASHTGIIARTLELPAVLGLRKATRLINHEDLIILDGTSGMVIVNPSEETLVEFEERRMAYYEYQQAISRLCHLAASTEDGLSLPVMGNIELPEEVVSVLDHGGEGIGLYRTEFQFLSRPDFPSEFELYDKYKDVVEVMGQRPVTIRTLDINGDKALAFNHEYEEANPALGMRAIRYCLQKPEVFRTQLRAILRAAVHGNVRLLLPLISSCEEVLRSIMLLDEAAESLEKEGIAYRRDIQVGVMIEVPSAVVMADVLAEMVDFFSIGTNDLIQYTLAIDRGNQQVAHMHTPLNPAILRMLKRTADVAHEKNIPVYMCGEMAGDPLCIPVLLGLGIDELSMNPQSIPAAKSMIRALSVEESRRFTRSLMRETRIERIMDRVQGTYGNVLYDKVYANGGP